MGVALGARTIRAKKTDTFQKNLERVCREINSAIFPGRQVEAWEAVVLVEDIAPVPMYTLQAAATTERPNKQVVS